jgi:hypothetical protein
MASPEPKRGPRASFAQIPINFLMDHNDGKKKGVEEFVSFLRWARRRL